MSAPTPLSPRASAGYQRRAPGPVPASSCPDRPMPHDTARLRLLDLAGACRLASADALLAARVFERETADIESATYVTRIRADMAALGVRLEQAAYHLKGEAHDPDLPGWLAHRAAGGVVLCKQADSSGRVVVADEERRAAQPVRLKHLLMKLGQRFRQVA